LAYVACGLLRGDAGRLRHDRHTGPRVSGTIALRWTFFSIERMEKQMRLEKLAIAFAAVALSVPAALAQPTPAPLPNERRDCPPDVANPVAPRNDETNGSANLSKELSQSNGVICPPAGVDPGLAVPPVGGGRTPVIPPPGTPGGNPNVIPK
jgi:hypothetical protein